MENPEGSPAPRRTVYEVPPRPGTNKRRRRRGKKKDRFAAQRVPMTDVYKELGDPSTWEQDRLRWEERIRQRPETNDEPTIPLEVRPIIAAAIEYGKVTHALGAQRATRALKTVAGSLSRIGSGAEVEALARYVATELEAIQGMLGRAYNPSDDVGDSYAT